MSSILRALQKLEKDTAGNSNDLDPVVFAKSSKALRKKTLGFQVAVVIFLSLFIGFIGAFLFRHYTQSKNPVAALPGQSAQKSAPDVAAKTQNKEKKQQTGKVEPEPVPISSKQMTAAQGSDPPQPAKQPQDVPVSADVLPKNHMGPITEETADEQDDELIVQGIEADAGMDERSIELENKAEIPQYLAEMKPEHGLEQKDANDPEIMANKTAPTVEITKIIEDNGITLQAISWSEDKNRRLAVINNKICREGESVSGYLVSRIDPDDVILSKAGFEGKLVFKIH